MTAKKLIMTTVYNKEVAFGIIQASTFYMMVQMQALGCTSQLIKWSPTYSLKHRFLSISRSFHSR